MTKKNILNSAILLYTYLTVPPSFQGGDYLFLNGGVSSLLLLVGQAKTLTPHTENEYQVSKTFDELGRFLKYKVNTQTWPSLYDALRNTLHVRNTLHRTTTRMRGR